MVNNTPKYNEDVTCMAWNNLTDNTTQLYLTLAGGAPRLAGAPRGAPLAAPLEAPPLTGAVPPVADRILGTMVLGVIKTWQSTKLKNPWNEITVTIL